MGKSSLIPTEPSRIESNSISTRQAKFSAPSSTCITTRRASRARATDRQAVTEQPPPRPLSRDGVSITIHHIGAQQRPLQVISMSNHPERRSSKRLAGRSMDDDARWGRRADRNIAAADFERDDDFQFVRKSKRTKTEKVEDPEPVKKSGRVRTATKPRATKGSAINGSIPEEKEVTASESIPTAKPMTRKSTRRKASVDASNEEPPLKIIKRPTRRSVRVSGEKLEEAVPAPAPEPVPAPAPAPVSVPQTNGTSQKRGRRAKSPPRPPPEPDQSPQHEPPVQSATIALPMSDTPVINRNKEMRKKGNTNRRSSLGMRGRRASSLIESGQTAIPHREVSPADFYKHIEAEGLTEPRRMKQLLTWCGERSLTGKPPHGTPNSNAILGARAIQDDLLRDFSSRSEFSDWFSREDDVPKAPVVLKPNPRNMELDEKLTQLEINIKRLQEEKKAWQAIRKPPPEQPPLFPEGETGPIVLPDFDLLDPEEGKIRGLIAEETASFNAIRSKTESRLRTIQSSLEFQIDQLADNVHKLEQRVLVAGKEADKVLSVSALRLRQREEREKASAGTKDMPVMEVLRSLGNILPEGGG
ncbi:kinetochore mis13 [Fusarium albosuccineum]|uniref:Kinetochore mis13 n=1 Tax=Fusarium albosuccineum TaxID=1237068 RepID=A0A8H4L5A2_9HYPO|nr:kinetochore mis13 [Fusarium albosuccineum]